MLRAGSSGWTFMFEAIGKYVGGKVLTAALVFAVAAGGYWCYTHPDAIQALGQVLKYVLVWLAVVLILPWASLFVTVWVVKQESNVAAAMLLIGLTALDAIFALYLSDWSARGAVTWMVLLFGFLSAGVYNFLVCDFLADRLEDNL